MSRYFLSGVLCVLLLSAPAHATTCADPLPPGVTVTPACTWVVRQWDPGVWLDNLGNLWTTLVGSSLAILLSGHAGQP